MERTKSTNLLLPDAINCSIQSNFTQIPNTLLRNPNISAKAKAVLCLLLSNQEGWHSCETTLLTMIKEKRDSLHAALQELEDNKYLLRIRYRSKSTKMWKGSFWAYTNTPGVFEIEGHLSYLDSKGLEAEISNYPDVGKPDVGKPDVGKRPLIILKENNTKEEKNILTAEQIPIFEYISPSMFDLFWNAYPRKEGKGKAFANWNKLCQKGNKRPTWIQIRRAIKEQKKSERWLYSSEQIPHPATWLNQSRWLDDPTTMKPFIEKQNENKFKPKFIKDPDQGRFDLAADGYYYHCVSGERYTP